MQPVREAFNLWFPRTRGDGPPVNISVRDEFLVPPHPRGWSR